MVSASLMPALSPHPSTSVFHGVKAFALSTMGTLKGWRAPTKVPPRR